MVKRLFVWLGIAAVYPVVGWVAGPNRDPISAVLWDGFEWVKKGRRG